MGNERKNPKLCQKGVRYIILLIPLISSPIYCGASVVNTIWLLSATGGVSGFIRDKSNGEAIPYVNVFLKSKPQYNAISNRSGYYVISGIPEGADTLVFCMIGYKEERRAIKIKPAEKFTVNIEMEIETIPLEPIVVSGERLRSEREIGISVRPIKLRDMEAIPAFIEKDLFRALQFIPGVVFVSDFSSALYIRGGGTDENLVLLDGVTVYNAYHVGGLFSTFNLDAIKGVDLYLGGFSSKYGGRTSSVLDICTKAGNNKEFHTTGDISILSAKAVLETPIPIWKGSCMLSGRRTYFDPILKLAGGWINYYFYDLHGKVNLEPSIKDKFTLSGYKGEDNLLIVRPDTTGPIIWGNTTISLMHQHLFTPKLFSTFVLPKSRYKFSVRVPWDASSFFDWSHTIDDIGIKGDLTYFLTNRNSILFGFEGKEITFASKLKTELWEGNRKVGDSVWSDEETECQHLCGYLENVYRLENRFVTNIGLRYNYWITQHPLFDTTLKEGEEYRLEPRISAKYFVKPDFTIKGAYGHYYQFITIPTISGEMGEMFMKLPTSFLTFWYPLGGKYEPLHAIHYIIGIEKWLAEDKQLTVEAYYKDMHNFLEMKIGMGGEIGEAEIERYSQGNGFAYGIEFMLKMKTNWIGYTYSLTKRKIDNLEFYPPHDRRHSVNISYGLPLGKTWNIQFAWIYGSGLPYTGMVGKYKKVAWDPATGSYRYQWEWIPGRRCGARLPPYHRLDIAFERKEFEWHGLTLSSYIQIINVYNHKNILWAEWMNYDPDNPMQELNPPRLYGIPMLPICPSIGIKWKF